MAFNTALWNAQQATGAATDPTSLADIRRLFIETTLRYDLIKDGDLEGNVDNGANRFINAGQRYLDARVDTPKHIMKDYAELAVGEYSFELGFLRSLLSASIISATGRRDITALYQEEELFWAEHGSPIAEWDSEDITNSNQDAQWTISKTGLAPDHGTGGLSTELGGEGTLSGDHSNKTMFVICPKVSVAATVEIRGKFFQRKLVEDSDYSYWTKMWPFALISASALMIERHMRNRQGMADAKSAVDEELFAIDADVAGFEMSGMNMILEG